MSFVLSSSLFPLTHRFALISPSNVSLPSLPSSSSHHNHATMPGLFCSRWDCVRPTPTRDQEAGRERLGMLSTHGYPHTPIPGARSGGSSRRRRSIDLSPRSPARASSTLRMSYDRSGSTALAGAVRACLRKSICGLLPFSPRLPIVGAQAQ